MAGFLAIRSFVVRAMLDEPDGGGRQSWRGYITDVTSGERLAWNRFDHITGIIAGRLATVEPGRHRSAAVSAPTLSTVLDDMLAVLESRLPPPDATLPTPNVTVDRVSEKLVGLGGLRGGDTSSPIGPQVLRGGRLDARVRFQLWDTSATRVDDAILDLQGRLLDDTTALRQTGFLKFAAAETSLAEHESTVSAWRKVASYEVLYEFQYQHSDDAPSLIARIPINTDPEVADSPDREVSVVTDHMVRWDEEGADRLAVAGPLNVATIDLLAFGPGADPGGTVTIARTHTGSTGVPVTHPDIATFLAAVSGHDPADVHADVTVGWAAFAAALNPAGDGIELGDWDEDLNPDPYLPFRLDLDPSVVLPTGNDRFEISYSDPGGLDQQAVLYLRVNAP